MTLLPAKLVAFLIENSVFNDMIFVVDFTLRVPLSWLVMFSTNTILPKIRALFYVFMRLHFRN
ncbi:hypothetical protein, partial [Paenibacillus sp. 598K]|uniref:hypothetical protein n=1 Tax=Paenibacillus sp. 598K TaxID=1117987 RepID=UPI001C88196D